MAGLTYAEDVSLWFMSLTQPLAHLVLFFLSIDGVLDTIVRGGGEGLMVDARASEGVINATSSASDQAH